MVAVIKPPITTLAKGRWVSEPIPVLIAAGNKPMAAIKAVITTGRILLFVPSRTEKGKSSFRAKLCL